MRLHLHGEPAQLPARNVVVSRLISAGLHHKVAINLLIMTAALVRTKHPRFAIVKRLEQQRARNVRNALVEAGILASADVVNVTSIRNWGLGRPGVGVALYDADMLRVLRETTERT